MFSLLSLYSSLTNFCCCIDSFHVPSVPYTYCTHVFRWSWYPVVVDCCFLLTARTYLIASLWTAPTYSITSATTPPRWLLCMFVLWTPLTIVPYLIPHTLIPHTLIYTLSWFISSLPKLAIPIVLPHLYATCSNEQKHVLRWLGIDTRGWLLYSVFVRYAYTDWQSVVISRKDNSTIPIIIHVIVKYCHILSPTAVLHCIVYVCCCMYVASNTPLVVVGVGL